MPAKNPVTPICRYGHGDLKQVIVDGQSEWNLLSTPAVRTLAYGKRGVISAFTMKVFICPACGYLEMFDEDPDITTSGQSKAL